MQYTDTAPTGLCHALPGDRALWYAQVRFVSKYVRVR